MTVLTQEIDRPDSGISGTAFTRLLRWLDEGSDSQGERYLEIRRRLVAYFDRRNRPAPDVLADETLDRVSRTLEESGRIRSRRPPLLLRGRAVRAPRGHSEGRRDVPFEETRSGIHHARTVVTATDDGVDHSWIASTNASTGSPEDRFRSSSAPDAKRQRIDRRRDWPAARDQHERLDPRVAAQGQPRVVCRRLSQSP
jgi:hypothetical protein